ncbi:MAG: site-2 protease family protein [Lewinellaceae bacterium]|nr:site-2 protease family protein [Lewinellaceae bacterium]
MRSSLKLFTWFGIPVHLHWTFGLIFVYALWIGYSNHLDVTGTLWLMGFFIALFACVLLHEYGHSLTARKYGVETKDIILTPIGGIARLERMPEKPVQEFLVAIAGPMVNVVIAIVLFGVSMLIFQGERWELFKWFLQDQLLFSGGEDSGEILEESGVSMSGILFYLPVLVATNIGLVVFNLIPAFPMDGGRIFRSLLAMRIGRVKATRAASLVGQVIAVIFIAVGLFNWQKASTLTLIGFFVFVTARTENSMVKLEDILRRFKARDLLRRNFTRLTENDWMQTPIEMLQHGLERNFLVFDMSDKLVRALEEEDILAALKKRDFSAEIARYVQRVEWVNTDESLQYVYHLLRQRGYSIIAVVEEGNLVGVIDEAGFQHFMRMKSVKV